MPASLKDLRNRIKNTKNIEQITKAMKLVSVAKFAKAQGVIIKARPYIKAFKNIVEDAVAASASDYEHELTKTNESGVISLFVISSERGLCGSYNGNITRLTCNIIDELRSKNKKICINCLGKKSFQSLTKYISKYKFEELSLNFSEIEKNSKLLSKADTIQLIRNSENKSYYEIANKLADLLSLEYRQKNIENFSVIYTKFLSAGNIPLVKEQILPIKIDVSSDKKMQVKTQMEQKILSFEPSVNNVLEDIIPKFFTSELYKILLETNASEHAARMMAMDSSTRNAKEILRKLESSYQRARQAAITKELIEIISGAEAI